MASFEGVVFVLVHLVHLSIVVLPVLLPVLALALILVVPVELGGPRTELGFFVVFLRDLDGGCVTQECQNCQKFHKFLKLPCNLIVINFGSSS